ncbi:zinc-binding dehydrogenase [Streptomyces sp. NPDC102394]|uniref:zinc-binding dehydrogenase n=1 Tax=Streptomyces sp. NPDC102394 TaxID=3366167 RepID=UPI0038183902
MRSAAGRDRNDAAGSHRRPPARASRTKKCGSTVSSRGNRRAEHAAGRATQTAMQRIWAGMRFSGVAVDPDPVALRGLVDLVEQGRLRVHVQETFPFEHVADAHRLLGGGHLPGKLVLTV